MSSSLGSNSYAPATSCCACRVVERKLVPVSRVVERKLVPISRVVEQKFATIPHLSHTDLHPTSHCLHGNYYQHKPSTRNPTSHCLYGNYYQPKTLNPKPHATSSTTETAFFYLFFIQTFFLLRHIVYNGNCSQPNPVLPADPRSRACRPTFCFLTFVFFSLPIQEGELPLLTFVSFFVSFFTCRSKKASCRSFSKSAAIMRAIFRPTCLCPAHVSRFRV